jgi:predicted PurR-regulated permease PerM
LTALILSLGVAFAQFAPDWTRIAIVAGIVLVGQFLEGNVLASQTGCNPILLPSFGYFRAIRIRVSFRGFVGLLLAVPLAAGSGVLIRFALARYFASPLYTSNRPP